MKKLITFITGAVFASMSFAQTADIARNVSGADIGDFNGIADFEVSFDTATDQSNIVEYRLMIVKNGTAFNVDSALNVSAANYTAYAAPLADNVVDTMMQYSTDTDGDTLMMNTPYQVYVLSFGGIADDSLSSPSASVTISDNIVGFPFFEDFEGGSIPSTWSLFDEDGDGFDWRISNPGNQEEAIGTYSAIGASWEPGGIGSLNPNNYMVMPAIDLSDVGGASNIEIAWQVICLNQNFLGDFYEIYVSTTGNEVADFLAGTSIFSEAIPGSNDFMERSANLSPFIGDTVWIAWRHYNSPDIERFAIDEISIQEKPAYDIAVQNVSFNNEYPIMPLFQLTNGYQFSADVINQGANDATGVTLNIDVNSGEFLETVAVNSIVASSSASASTVNTFMPFDTGTYVVEYGVLMDSTDQNTSNNVAYDAFRVTETEMGRDKGLGTYGGTFGIGSGIDGILGQVYEFTSEVNLFSVDAFFVQPTVGDTLRAEVYEFDGNQPTLKVAQSDPFTFQTDEAAWRTLDFNFGDGTVLFEGQYVIGIHEFQENMTLGTSNDNFMNNTSWIFYQGAWSKGEDDGFEFVYFIRANVNDDIEVENSVASSISEISLLPNPAKDVVTLQNAADYNSVDVIDITGKTVLSITNNANKNLNLNISTLETGVYVVRAAGNEKVATQKLVIE